MEYNISVMYTRVSTEGQDERGSKETQKHWYKNLQ